MKSKSILTVLAIALIMCIAFSACGGNSSSNEKMSSKYVTIDSICIDDSYIDEDDSNLKLVYLFYTVTTDDQNLEISSAATSLTINDTNTYSSERVIGACDYASSYYFSDYIKNVNVGESLKVVETFKIPAGDLESGKTITLSNNIPEMDKIKLTTDNIVTYENAEAIAQAIDPNGYAEEIAAREEADTETTEKAKSLLNGYYWSFFVNNTTYEIEFYAPNEFEVRTSLGVTNSGTYVVQNGYISCTYDSNNYTVNIPYEFTDGDIKLETADAFDVNM